MIISSHVQIGSRQFPVSTWWPPDDMSPLGGSIFLVRNTGAPRLYGPWGFTVWTCAILLFWTHSVKRRSWGCLEQFQSCDFRRFLSAHAKNSSGIQCSATSVVESFWHVFQIYQWYDIDRSISDFTIIAWKIPRWVTLRKLLVHGSNALSTWNPNRVRSAKVCECKAS